MECGQKPHGLLASVFGLQLSEGHHVSLLMCMGGFQRLCSGAQLLGALGNAPHCGKNVGSTRGGEVLSASVFDVEILWMEYECGIPKIQLS